MNRLPFLLLAVLASGCGPYDGDGVRAQHQDGVVSQATLDGAPVTSPDAEERAREKRLAKEAERQARMADATPEPTPAPEPTPEPTPAPVTAVEEPPAADTTIPPLPSAATEEEMEPATPRREVEGNLAALIAEEQARVAAESGTETPAPDASDETPSADPGAEEAPAPDDGEAAPTPDTGDESETGETPATDDPFAGSSDPVASLPAADELPPVASVTGSALPPCDPYDLTSVALRDLSLAQTFGEGETARALLRSSGGKEYVVRRGSVVGPDGARVVKVTPGELILAEIQFDMSGAPVMVRKALRMSVPE